MRSGSLRQKLMLIIAGKAVLFLVAGLILQENERQSTLQMIETLQGEKSRTLKQLLSLREGPKVQFVRDNTYWDELYNNVLKPDQVWAEESVGLAAKDTGFEAVWIVNRQGKVVYEWRDPARRELTKMPVDASFITKEIGGKSAFSEGFIRLGDQMHRINMARIHKSADSRRLGPYTGYMVAADWWSPADLKELSELTQTSASLNFDNAGGKNTSTYDDMGNYEIGLPLMGFGRKPIAEAHFKGRNEAVYQSIESTARNTLLFLTLVLAILGSMVWMLMRRVERPLAKISRAISEERPELVLKISRGTDEVAKLALLTMEFYAQRQQLQSINESLENRVQERTKELEQAYDAVILGWSRAMDSKDKETEGHTQRVAEMSVYIGKQLGLDDETLIWLYRGALLHDIGKIGVPDAVLLKPGKLTEQEMAVIREHPVLAYEMLKPVKFLEPCLCVPHYHHEKYDGTGYPEGLRGEEIPLLARIFAVADVWDALRSDRPYRKSWSEAETRAYMEEQSGTHFDPQVVKAFLRAAPLTHPSDEHWDRQRREVA